MSKLAVNDKKTLDSLGEASSAQHEEYLTLGDCCWFALNEKLGWGGPTPCNYLSTVDEFAKSLGEVESWKFWRRLYRGRQSAFLDVLSEAAWGIHFRDYGYPAQFEAPFGDHPVESKDADFSVLLEGEKWWLDVISLGVEKPTPPANQHVAASVGRRDVTSIAAELGRKARNKYKRKFKDAVRSRSIHDCRIGILVCVLKRESSILQPFLALETTDEVCVPAGVFDDEHPGLDLVAVHTLRASAESDVLRPVPLCTWVRPGARWM
ncbi:hypothetical protein [Paraburkholderia aspalathi]|uniref:hypothetical protein n=1 Tax=Paraburkholderia aspalathi TaxID=1324617 RepID=UPI00190E2D3F|nr:hypothetical protein [Paraburkholderia aspalathi]MBK3843667.1 hypothetical protein [Paraburkholderia aspalathi]